MILLSLLLALVAQRLAPPPAHPRLESLAGRLCLWLARRLDAGDAVSGRLALVALLAATCLPVAVVAWLAAALHPLVGSVLDALVLYASLRFFEPVPASGSQASAASIEHGLRQAHHGTFALLLCFAVLGAAGVVLHVALRRASELWRLGEANESRPFGEPAVTAFRIVDWLPQRATALGFAVVGNFEDAVYCWRSQAPAWMHERDAVVLAAGAGALGVVLASGPADEAGEALSLGTGEAPGEESRASLEGLAWRALVLWGIVIAALWAIAA